MDATETKKWISVGVGVDACCRCCRTLLATEQLSWGHPMGVIPPPASAFSVFIGTSGMECCGENLRGIASDGATASARPLKAYHSLQSLPPLHAQVAA